MWLHKVLFMFLIKMNICVVHSVIINIRIFIPKNLGCLYQIYKISNKFFLNIQFESWAIWSLEYKSILADLCLLILWPLKLAELITFQNCKVHLCTLNLPIESNSDIIILILFLLRVLRHLVATLTTKKSSLYIQ